MFSTKTHKKQTKSDISSIKANKHLAMYSRVLLEKLTGCQLVNKFPAFYENQRFITIFITACYLPLP